MPSKAHKEGRAAHASSLATQGFIIVMAFIGYEWFMSGLSKLVRGGFASGLADELRDKSKGTVGWYQSFLDGTAIPNARALGILIEVTELAIGIAFIAAAIALLFRWERLSYREELMVWWAIAISAVGGIVMTINFHLANGASHPWLIPKDGFDEGVDMDSLLPLIQLVFLVVSTKLLIRLRREHAAARAVDAANVPTTEGTQS